MKPNAIPHCAWATVLSVLGSTHTQVLAQGAAPLLAMPTSAESNAEPGPGSASEQPDRWVLGATLASTPTYMGGSERKLGLRPVLAGRIGRWMVSTSSARSLAGMDLAGGISTSVLQDDKWSVSVGARLTRSRNSSDDPVLSGLPDIRASLGLRVGVGYAIAPGWRATASVQQDLLHGQGMRGNFGLGWSKPVGSGWVLGVNGGVGWANGRAMKTHFGVEPQGALPNRPVYQPGAGWESWGWGVGLSRSLSPHWRLAGSIGRSTLVGQAARSPLTQQRSATMAQVTLAYVGW